MKDKQTYLTKGFFALLLFVILGYVVKFYPEQLVALDSSVQTAIRGDLPETLTLIFRGITRLIDLPIVISWAIILIAIFYLKKWKTESLLVAGNLGLAGILIVSLKHLYQRPRPDILHLVEEKGFSFPTGGDFTHRFLDHYPRSESEKHYYKASFARTTRTLPS